MAKLSAKELLAKKNIIEDKKNKKIEIEVPDIGTFTFRLPSIADYEDAQAYGKNRDNPGYEQNKYLIYACCLDPKLDDEELMKGFEVKAAVDLIDKLMLVGEVSSIATILVEKAGFDKEALKVVEEVKN
ncbi:hypothetical protein NH286_03190 [Anaerococcus sp. NML200574]|uniref:phage tail assembly chaperone n=1 Tax=Anaerococcus sp. NML200574 TaxID=2954486 RepID=UPI002238CCD2|nr:hypothetical protein [Anaerococcus sp. NML200574]MCW6678158.1 hypothetical protein [Anaerococcus sp. NML200574]